MNTASSHYPDRHHPETCDDDDVWAQVRRTVNGRPVSAEQIAMIVAQITTALELTQDDTLLDLCCGNGALTTSIFSACHGGLGVDYSAFLIDVANRRFVKRSSEGYLLADALAYLQQEAAPERFTKVLCYGAFQYFPPETALQMLRVLHDRFTCVETLFLGQLPDRSRAHAFYKGSVPPADELAATGGTLGAWRTPAEMDALAVQAGWRTQIVRMPDSFYSAHYRYDAVLKRS
ncbi:class I SAM-dependent methyltransferase [Pararobbsia silviterrae]|uniref:Methyltransferase domain-containing protein n=1 Tax=Pararobbsia silviterrae TaxID=1792498 RepID=A0A494X666_9BURK|nr:class I SAM-dependent methyltransferase [Pararobbsia silviterrae]RKP46187.1 methyltransferase domain-containing protein [Pararobbsia silviterrae]